jgi:hypothetical protein
MAASPAPIKAKPANCLTSKCSPNPNVPMMIALTGIRKVTSKRLVAPAVARIRKYRT